MTTFLLIRHASHDLLGRALAGRTRDIGLNAQGRQEALELAERLANAAVHALYASPRLRARETAEPLAVRLGLPTQAHDGIDEVDFGDWDGQSFHDLADAPGWATWVERRSTAEPPNGETIVSVQRRFLHAIAALGKAHDGRTVALVSHADPIRAALAGFLGMSLDDLERFEIAPASISVVAAGDGWAQVKRVNDTGALR